MKTTLNAIKENAPCKDGYRKLLTFLNKTKADNDPLALSTIFESNGFMDTVWCFCAVSGYEKEKRMFAIFCARQVQPLMADPISINAINVAERYANGQATVDELKAVADTAYTAARAAARAADSAYSAADSAAAYYAYSAAAADAAYTAAYYAAYYDAAYTTAYYARAANPNIMPVLEAYLKNLISEAEK